MRSISVSSKGMWTGFISDTHPFFAPRVRILVGKMSPYLPQEEFPKEPLDSLSKKSEETMGKFP